MSGRKHVELHLLAGPDDAGAGGQVHEDGGLLGAGWIEGVRLMCLGEFTESHGMTFRVPDLEHLEMFRAAMEKACAAAKAKGGHGIPVHVTHAEDWGRDGLNECIGECANPRIVDGVLLGDDHIAKDAVEYEPRAGARMLARAKTRSHSFGKSLVFNGWLVEPPDDDANRTPIFECETVFTADFVGRPATRMALLSEGKKPMADTAPTTTQKPVEAAAAAGREHAELAAARAEMAQLQAALAAEREQRAADKRKADLVAATAAFSDGVRAGKLAPAHKEFWLGDGTPANPGLAVIAPDALEAWLAKAPVIHGQPAEGGRGVNLAAATTEQRKAALLAARSKALADIVAEHLATGTKAPENLALLQAATDRAHAALAKGV